MRECRVPAYRSTPSVHRITSEKTQDIRSEDDDNLVATFNRLRSLIFVHPPQHLDERRSTTTLLTQQIRQMHHETNLPQRHSQSLISIETPREPVRLVQRRHKLEELLRRYRRVDSFVGEEFVRRLDEKKLQNAFDDNLSKDSFPIREHRFRRRSVRCNFLRRRRRLGIVERSRSDEIRSGRGDFGRKGRILRSGRTEILVKELVGGGGLEQMKEGSDDPFPSIRREFFDVVLEELLQTRRSYPRERVILCVTTPSVIVT